MRRSRYILWLLLGVLFSTIMSVQAQDATIYITTQRFDTGLMIWRSDNATIYVLGDNGKALVFGSPSYINLPDNPIFGTPPSRLRPIFGFGKVWGSNKNVRDMIGWPKLPEIGFNAWMLIQNHTTYFRELDNSLLEIKSDGTWSRKTAGPIPTPTQRVCPYPHITGRSDGNVCPDQPITSQAAYQPYERGFMIWLAHTGDVWVFLSSDNRWQQIPQASYEGFADAPVQTPPTNRVQPINAFGRVWYNLKAADGLTLSTALGWGTSAETGYTATYQRWTHATTLNQYFSLPDGRIVSANIVGGFAARLWNWEK